MKILALSTAEQCSSLAIVDGTRLLYEEFWENRRTHSKRAMDMVENALENRVGIPLDEIDAFVAAKGPGSFTGLRIGISVIQALAYSVNKSAFGVSSLDGIAYRFSGLNQPVCVMMDAKRSEVYTAVYRFENTSLKSKTKENVASPVDAIRLAGDGAFFAGTGALAYLDVISNELTEYAVSDGFSLSVSAAAMVRAADDTQGFYSEKRNILAPSYIRKSDAEMQFAEKQGQS